MQLCVEAWADLFHAGMNKAVSFNQTYLWAHGWAHPDHTAMIASDEGEDVSIAYVQRMSNCVVQWDQE